MKTKNNDEASLSVQFATRRYGFEDFVKTYGEAGFILALGMEPHACFSFFDAITPDSHILQWLRKIFIRRSKRLKAEDATIVYTQDSFPDVVRRAASYDDELSKAAALHRLKLKIEGSQRPVFIYRNIVCMSYNENYYATF